MMRLVHQYTSRLCLGVLALAGLAGCSSVGPVTLPAEDALAAADSAFWRRIAEARSEEWYLVLNRGEEALDWRLRAIDSATVSVDMETFLWKPDYSGLQVLARLLAAADRGVRVRVTLDDSFTMHEDLVLHAFDEHPNIEFRIYNPYRRRVDSMVMRQLFNLGDFARVNHRMHNKALVVDGWAAIIGGRNLADEYFGHDHAFNFRDMEVLASGRTVQNVVRHFDKYWNSGWAFPIHGLIDPPRNAPDLAAMRRWLEDEAGAVLPRDPDALEVRWLEAARQAHPGDAYFYSDNPAHLNPAAAAEAPNQLAAVLMKLIDDAQTEVILVSAYLIPTPELEAAVERAEKRGVQVRILTNSLRSNNHLAAYSAYSGHIRKLVGHGADLHEVHPEADDRSLYMLEPVGDKRLGLHAKLMIVDDARAFVGSCNLDPRSLQLNTEVGLVIHSEPLNRTLRDLVAADFSPRNAWAVKLSEEGRLQWHRAGVVLDAPPSDSPIQRLENWFMGLLPIDQQM